MRLTRPTCPHGKHAHCEACEADAKLDLVCDVLGLDCDRASYRAIRGAISALVDASRRGTRQATEVRQ